MARFHFAGLMAVALVAWPLAGGGTAGEQRLPNRPASAVDQDSATDISGASPNRPTQATSQDPSTRAVTSKSSAETDAKTAKATNGKAAAASGSTVKTKAAGAPTSDPADRAARREKLEIQQHLRSKRPEDRIDAMRRLSVLGDPESAKLLIERASRDPADEVRRAGSDVLLKHKDDPTVCDELLKAVNRNAHGTHSAPVNLPLMVVLLSSDLPEVEHDTLLLLDKIAAGPNGVLTVTMLADELGSHARALDVRTLKKFGKLSAFDKYFAVRRAVVQALVRIPEKDTVDALVGLLNKLDGEAEADAVNHLNAVTSRMFGAGNSAAWSNWWAQNKETYKYTRPSTAAYEPLLDQGSYYGLPLNAKRLVFIIDISGSMLGPRIAAAERELLRAIAQLRDDVSFNIVVFNSAVDTWQKQLVPATSHNKQAAALYISKLAAQHTTASYDALETAFNYDAEAIYFLTDGDPTTGKIVDPAKIVEAITALNRSRRMTIHTIGIGAGMPDGPSDSFLRVLAEDNYGVYRRVDE